jgi:hypothetical protein
VEWVWWWWSQAQIGYWCVLSRAGCTIIMLQ